MADVKIEVKPKPGEPVLVTNPEKSPVPKPKIAIDPQTAMVVAGVLSKLPLSDTVKGLMVKLFIFLFGIFCGIGIVYKSGLPLDGNKTENPPAAVSTNTGAYQKRIDELKKANEELTRALEAMQAQPQPEQPFPQPKTPAFPQAQPQPKVEPQPKAPVAPVGPRPGFVIPLQ